MTDPAARLQRLLSELPARIAEAQAAAAGVAARQFVAEAADGAVAATVDGSGQLVGVQLSATLARRMDNLTLGERIAEAVNRALDDVDAARDELLTTALPDDQLAGAEEVFAYRIDQLQENLDALESRLRGLGG